MTSRVKPLRTRSFPNKAWSIMLHELSALEAWLSDWKQPPAKIRAAAAWVQVLSVGCLGNSNLQQANASDATPSEGGKQERNMAELSTIGCKIRLRLREMNTFSSLLATCGVRFKMESRTSRQGTVRTCIDCCIRFSCTCVCGFKNCS